MFEINESDYTTEDIEEKMDRFLQDEKCDLDWFTYEVINNLAFVMTCPSCPEQYYVFDSECNKIGYVRLRFGFLFCEYLSSSDREVVYSESFDDEYMGMFKNEEQRKKYLLEISAKLLEKLRK